MKRTKKKILTATVALCVCLIASSCGNGINNETTPSSITSIIGSDYTIEMAQTDGDTADASVPTGDVDDIISDYVNETNAVTEKLPSTDAPDATEADGESQYAPPASEDGIRLLGSYAECGDDGVTVDGSTVTISKAGTYYASGTLDDGQIIVTVEKTDKVELVLNGAFISCSTSAPIYVTSCDEFTVTLADGTVNKLVDGAQYEYDVTGENEPDGALFSKDDMTLGGGGSLVVTANYNNGIVSKNDLKIEGGTITVVAKHDGIRGKDSVRISDGTVNVQSGGDAIKSNNAEETDKGYITIDGGHFNISASEDAIQAETTLTVNGGSFLIKTGAGSGSSWSGNPYGNASEASAKGLKASGSIAITGGNYNISSNDDAIHSNGDITIAGGVIEASSGDDGVHADNNLTISNGKINITKSYEGLESTNITIKGGTTRIKASDDGINGAGGNDGSSSGRPGSWGGGMGGGNAVVTISGGYLYVDAGGDGLDSNGSFTMTGGTVLVDGPTNGGNGALDYNSSFNVSGGVLIAAGSTGMAQNASQSSTQCCVLVFTSGNADTVVNLSDSNGKSIVTYKPSKQFGCILISTPDMKLNTSYTVSTGGACSGENTDGLFTSGVYSGGSVVQSYTQSSTVMSLGGSGGMGGGMGGGARPEKPGRW